MVASLDLNLVQRDREACEAVIRISKFTVSLFGQYKSNTLDAQQYT